MALTCDKCGAAFRQGDLDLERGIATCLYCHAVSRLAGVSDSDEDRPAATREKDRPPVPRPEGIAVVEDGRTLRITRRWFHPMLFFLLFFCIAWDSFLIFWYSMALGVGSGPFSIIAVIFPVVHVAVGVGLTYFTLAGFLNRTSIEAASGELTIRHGPIPWRGNRSIPVDDLDQLYSEERVSRGRQGATSTTYRLNAVLKDGRKLKLLSGLPEPDQALYLEQAIEEHLGIQDRKMRGEYEP